VTEAELWQAFFAANERVGDSFNSLLSVTFAYLATAYIVGKRLSTFQALVVSFLYAYAAALMTVSCAAFLNRELEFASQLRAMHPDRYFVMSPDMLAAAVVLFALSIPVSLFFMYQIRRSPKLGTGDT
jgi:hypothetical protein